MEIVLKCNGSGKNALTSLMHETQPDRRQVGISNMQGAVQFGPNHGATFAVTYILTYLHVWVTNHHGSIAFDTKLEVRAGHKAFL